MAHSALVSLGLRWLMAPPELVVRDNDCGNWDKKSPSLKTWCLVLGTVLFGSTGAGCSGEIKNWSTQYEEFHENNAISLNPYDAVCCRYKCWYPGAACSASSTNRFA